MSSLITPDNTRPVVSHPPAIHLENVSKVYQLYGSQGDQLIDVLGLQRFGIKPRTQPKEFVALNDISLTVPKGHRIGIVGRNGAGKTTLLKLICGNFAPSKGQVVVNGTVQALMNIGTGFHPDFTGRENVQASLQYSGLSRADYEAAMTGIEDFCELGDFLDQPFKTYSLGMMARLMFASATAIKPDILIVDEVLGAGDAYFVAKSKQRVEALVNSGCTMLLVSHSMQQVLELCDEAIWLHHGSVVMQDSSFKVVKAYEEHLFGVLKPINSSLELRQIQENENTSNVAKDDQMLDDQALPTMLTGAAATSIDQEITVLATNRFNLESNLQAPHFIPHQADVHLIDIAPKELKKFPFQAKGGISRWESVEGVKICGFGIVSQNGLSNRLLLLRPAKIVLLLRGELEGDMTCRYGVTIDDLQGRSIAKVFSELDHFSIKQGEEKTVELLFNPLQLGPGEYTIGISVLGDSSLEGINQATRYDLLGRSFQLIVEIPSSMAPLTTQLFHTAEWNFGQKKSKELL